MFNFPQLIWNIGRRNAPDRSLAAATVLDVALAAALAGAAFAIRYVLGYLGAKVLIFAVCYPAVLIAGIVAGIRAGVLTLIFTTLLFWWAYVPDPYSFAVPTAVDAINIGLYVVVASVLIWIAHRYRTALTNLILEKIRNEVLVREMSHRAKNSVAVINSIVMQSLKNDPVGARKVIGRIAALKHGEDLLRPADVSPSNLRNIFYDELRGYEPSRLELAGPETFVAGELAKSLTMIVHEFATNAVKYGAWSTSDGRVKIDWGSTPTEMFVVWSETGVDVSRLGFRPGFGTFLVESLISAQKGQAVMHQTANGVEWRLTFPIALVHSPSTISVED